MRFASFILAFALFFAGPSLAGSADGSLPHIGSFAFNDAPPAAMPAPLMVASAR